jgi:hypothetical protein
MSIIWIIVIGFVAGILAKLIHPGPNEPSGSPVIQLPQRTTISMPNTEPRHSRRLAGANDYVS